MVLLDNFQCRLEVYFACANLTDHQQVIFASSLLNKSAETWVAAVPLFQDFAAFKTSLIKKFRPANAAREARAQLTLRQKGSARNYLAQFQDNRLDGG